MHALAYGISGIVTTILGLAVLLKSRGSSERKMFVLLCLVTAGWLFGFSGMESSFDPGEALFFAKCAHSCVIVLPIVYVHFTRYFLRLSWLRHLYRPYYALAVVFFVLLWTNDQFIPGVLRQPWGYYPVGGPIMLADALEPVS